MNSEGVWPGEKGHSVRAGFTETGNGGQVEGSQVRGRRMTLTLSQRGDAGKGASGTPEADTGLVSGRGQRPWA